MNLAGSEPTSPGRFARPTEPERLLYRSPAVRVGTFRCGADDPGFGTAGPIEGYTVYFPRTAVWIEHRGARPFVADPAVVTIYNQGQPYVRRRLAADGDRGEWFSVSRELACAIASSIDPAVNPDRPFQAERAWCSPELYRRQRRLVLGLQAGTLAPPSIEREVEALVRAVLLAAGSDRPGPRASSELIERTKSELAKDPIRGPSIRELSDRVGASPWHLCRLFRRVTGVTLHQYVLDLRLRLALERLETPNLDLSGIAHALGFSSHSHFTLVFRRRLGATPSRIKAELRGAGGFGLRAIS